MLPIRKRIARPYLAIIILMPITTFFLFNVMVSFYTQAKATEDLLESVNSISSAFSDEIANDINLPNISTPNKDKENWQTSINLVSIINNQRHSKSTELVIFNAKGELSSFFNVTSFLNDELANIIYQKSESLNFGEVDNIKYNSDTYYISKVDCGLEIMSDRVLYITQGLLIDDFVSLVNIVFISVALFISAIALIVSTRVTNSVAKPIERLTSLVGEIKNDELLIIDDTSDNIELQKLTNEINALNRRIYHYDKSQRNFLHNASHELRTPLMSIQGYADGIEMDIFSDYKGTAHLISEQSKRLTKLVDSLLKLARAENFNNNQKLTRLNLSDSLLNLLNSYNGYALSQDIKINLDIAPNIFVNSNTELLQGSVGNIISNAILYAKSTVEISLKQVGENSLITIKDDGNGIENVDTIFDKFSKGDDGNFGLGLSIAKTSVEMMNGRISVSNNNGAVFEVYI